MSEDDLQLLRQIIPLLIPVFLVQIVLIVIALRDLSQRSTTRGAKWIWVAVILFINLIGPILYFTIGRGED